MVHTLKTTRLMALALVATGLLVTLLCASCAALSEGEGTLPDAESGQVAGQDSEQAAEQASTLSIGDETEDSDSAVAGEWSAYPLEEVADMRRVDDLQIVSGVVRASTDEELMGEKFGYEHTPKPDDRPVTLLVLDTPTFAEAWDGTYVAFQMRPVKLICLYGSDADWASLDGQRLTLGIAANDMAFPSDVQPYDVEAYHASLL